MFISEHVSSIPASGIRKMFALAEEYDEVINLCVGQPDFETPAHIVEAACSALRNGYTKYVSNSGLMELREAVAKRMREFNHIECGPENVMVTNGAAQALCLAVFCLIDPGDEVISQDPGYPNYEGYFALAGAKSVKVKTTEDEHFHLTPERIEQAVTPRTRFILLNSPSNPTGAVLTEEEIRGIAEVAKKHDLIVISDEPYEEIIYDGRKNISIASLPGMFERTVTINSVSKSYAMTGFRIGWAVAPVNFIEEMTLLQESLTSCVNASAQYAAKVALESDQSCVRRMRDTYEQRINMLTEGINQVKGLSLKKPEGAFYAFVNSQGTGLSSEEFAMKLLREQQVVVTPGDAFGEAGEGFIRISFASSIEALQEAVRRMKLVFGEK